MALWTYRRCRSGISRPGVPALVRRWPQSGAILATRALAATDGGFCPNKGHSGRYLDGSVLTPEWLRREITKGFRLRAIVLLNHRLCIASFCTGDIASGGVGGILLVR
jgi:hypothetical protein